MNLASKVFKNNMTGDVVKVIDSFENIAILENKQKQIRKHSQTKKKTKQVNKTEQNEITKQINTNKPNQSNN